MSEPAVRYRLAHEDSNVSLVSDQRITVVVPPSEEILEGCSGFWCDLRDADDNVLYRHAMRNPLTPEREVFDPDTGEVSKIMLDRVAGSFWVITPDHPQARFLVLQGSPVGTRDPAAEVARFDLEEHS
ncbi:hypothetical protein ACFXPZ_38610 [Streptomyces sp. NPDC059101]|uniref:hypothetical protein n=1 Tax=Streptomyces sp. NPDC059101 TaxID=3346728 RepID=UPI0036BACD8D